MRDKNYKGYCFKLDEKTVKNLKKLKGIQSWNLFFIELIKLKEGGQSGRDKKRNAIGNVRYDNKISHTG